MIISSLEVSFNFLFFVFKNSLIKQNSALQDQISALHRSRAGHLQHLHRRTRAAGELGYQQPDVERARRVHLDRPGRVPAAASRRPRPKPASAASTARTYRSKRRPSGRDSGVRTNRRCGRRWPLRNCLVPCTSFIMRCAHT